MFDAPYSLDAAERPDIAQPPARNLPDGRLAARVTVGAGADRDAEGEVSRRFAPCIRLPVTLRRPRRAGIEPTTP